MLMSRVMSVSVRSSLYIITTKSELLFVGWVNSEMGTSRIGGVSINRLFYEMDGVGLL